MPEIALFPLHSYRSTVYFRCVYHFLAYSYRPVSYTHLDVYKRQLRANADKYGLNPDQIAVWGASAGGHLAQFMGVTNGMDRFEDLSMGNADYSSDVQAVISNYGISDLTKWDMPCLLYTSRCV